MEIISNVAHAHKTVNLSRLLLDSRYQVCTEYVSGGADAALAAVATQSIHLYRYVYNGDLVGRFAFRALLQVSVNLGLVGKLGKAAVRTAIYAGPRFYDELAVAA